MRGPTLKLYGHVNRLSPNTLKLRVALAEVDAVYEYLPVDLAKGEQLAAEFLAINPHGKVPVLVEDDFVLPESDAILFYIAERYPEPRLLATDAARARPRPAVVRLRVHHAVPGVLRRVPAHPGGRARAAAGGGGRGRTETLRPGAGGAGSGAGRSAASWPTSSPSPTSPARR